MPEFSSPHTPGRFCWPELATTEQKSAVTFYRSVFGWDVDEHPMGPSAVYSMFTLHGKEVCAAFTLRTEERQHGMPPHWASYVAVTSADETAKRTQELGGRIVVPPFDVTDAGRMAVLQDPTGAMLSVWQAKRHIGARILDETDALCWTELATGDTAAAAKFYTQLFGWSAKTTGAGATAYTEFSVQGRPDAGMMALNPEWGNVPPNWLPYFAVSDCDATAAKTKELGGRFKVPPKDIPNVGRFAVIQDPQGAVFAVIRLSRT